MLFRSHLDAGDAGGEHGVVGERLRTDKGDALGEVEGERGGDDHEALERTLRERAQVIRELEAELARRDRLVRDLASALEEASSGGEAATLRAKLDALALDLARREGEAQAAEWTNQELERQLAGARAAGDAPARLAAVLDELDALRIALVQEHEARVRAESKARAGSAEHSGAAASAAASASAEER